MTSPHRVDRLVLVKDSARWGAFRSAPTLRSSLPSRPFGQPWLPSTLSPGIPVVKEARHPLCEGLKHLKHLKAIRGFFLTKWYLARKPGNCLLNFKCFKIVQAKTGNSAVESERGPRPLVCCAQRAPMQGCACYSGDYSKHNLAGKEFAKSLAAE